jgi:hypothetical protein
LNNEKELFKEETPMTEQNKTSQAENAIEAVQHAVDQAETHPSENKMEEADHSLRHAEIAVRQAAESGSGKAEHLTRQIRAERDTLDETKG